MTDYEKVKNEFSELNIVKKLDTEAKEAAYAAYLAEAKGLETGIDKQYHDYMMEADKRPESYDGLLNSKSILELQALYNVLDKEKIVKRLVILEQKNRELCNQIDGLKLTIKMMKAEGYSRNKTMGRPTIKFNDDWIKDLVEAGMSCTDIAAAFGCSKVTMKRHLLDLIRNGGIKANEDMYKQLGFYSVSGNLVAPEV